MVKGRQFWQNWRLMQIQSHSPEAVGATAATPPPQASPPPQPALLQAPPAHTDDPTAVQPAAQEFGGPAGPEPTRFGDWERKGRCIDF